MEIYRPVARWLHWITAALVLTTIPAGLTMVREGIPRGLQDPLYLYHKNVGVVILLLVVARLVYRWRHPPPPLPGHLPGWQVKVAEVSHWGLYVLLIVMAVSGYVRVRAGGFPLEGLDALGVPDLVGRSRGVATVAMEVHDWTKSVLIVVIGLHVGAALHHAVVLRDGVFKRMWPGRG